MSVRVVPLTCPDCGSGLIGLRYDKIFFCLNCKQGMLPSERPGGWERYPLRFALSELPEKQRLYLPFWEIKIEGSGVPVNKQQEAALKRLDRLDTVWVMGASMVRPSYYGDLSVIYTEKGVVMQPDPHPPRTAFLAGCVRTIEDVMTYVRLLVTLILDRKADVTGMELEIKTGDAALWAVPFYQRGDKIIDPFTGTEIPSFALDDLEDIKRISRR